MQQKVSKKYTFETRLNLTEIQEELLSQYANICSIVTRKLYSEICKGNAPANLKADYLKHYQITARHFNSIRVSVEGMVASFKELCNTRITNLKYAIDDLENKLEKISNPNRKHQKKRRLFFLKTKLEELKYIIKNNMPSICFGTKKLFNAQFHLNKNGYETHEDWLKDWRFSRSNQFFLLGSKDESGGNQLCTATINEDQSFNFRLRLPNALVQNGKYLDLKNINFRYGRDEIIKALHCCYERNKLQKFKDPHFKEKGTAICYRFLKDKKSWKLFVTVNVELPETMTSKKHGVIGVDINSDHLAVIEIDRYGNPIEKKRVALNTYGKNSKQSKAIIGDACAFIVEFAKKTKKPIVLENLDFTKKKQTLRELNSSHLARTLSSFNYNNIYRHMLSRSNRKGVDLFQVNPAYTSVIGRVKFANRYGLTIHQGAALAIGRRYLQFSERLPKNLDKIPDGKGGHVTLVVPVRNQHKHVWSQWAEVSKKLKTVLVAHFRKLKISLRDISSFVTAMPPNFDGEIPAREFVDKAVRSSYLANA